MTLLLLANTANIDWQLISANCYRALVKKNQNFSRKPIDKQMAVW